MTDTRFSVSLYDLADTSRRLGAVEVHLGEATRRVQGLGRADAGDLRSGLEVFADHWEHGLHRLRGQVHQLHAALGVAHEGYADNEAQLSSVLGPGHP